MMKLPPEVAALNPYRHINSGDDNCIRLSNDLERTDVFRIRSVVMDYGFLNAAISRFVKHLYTFCEIHKLTLTDRKILIAYVNNLADGTIIPNDELIAYRTGSTTSGPNREGTSGDERRGIETLDANDAGTSNVKRTRKRK